ncbi:reverse transcriptase domain-containing protein [Tanacetum coccineum]
MAKGYEEKIAFFTREGVFCYKRLPFGLKNARATYQRLVNTVISNQIGRNLEVHVDDMCSFGKEEGPFLGYLVTKKGIKANPSKVKEISDMKPPKTVKEIQSLNKELATLSRFLPKGTDKTLPFLKVLKNCASKKIVQWTQEAEEAFQNMKEYKETLPTVTTPIKGKTLVMYQAVLEESISAVLLAERRKKQIPIYFKSQALKWAKMEYPWLKKLTLALVYATRRLQQYFQAHPIQILTDKPIKQILARPEKSGRQILAETPTTESKEKETQNVKNEELDPENTWKLYTDGASRSDDSGAGLILVNPEGREYTYALRFEFATTNNEVAYEAMLASLRIIKEMKIKDLDIFVDSQLVANQNKKADALSKVASTTFSKLAKEVLVEVLHEKSIVGKESYLSAWLRCVGPTQAKSIIEEIHQGSCGMHAGPRLVCGKKRIKEFEARQNENKRREDLDILEERREIASIKEAYYKQKLERYYNKHVRPSTFKQGTYVLRLNSSIIAEFQGKIGPTWEGPYVVKKAYRDGAYKLETLSDSWNGSNLLKIYM